MIDYYQALRISLLAGFLSLDGTAFLQLMISEPLPACGLVGLLTGHAAAGLIMGIAFQLLFVSDLPVGSHLPRDASLLSLGALGAALTCGGDRGAGNPDLLAAAALLAVAGEPLFAWSGRLVRQANRMFTPPVRELLAAGHYRKALFLAQGGLLLFFLRGFLTVLVFSLAGGELLMVVVRRLPAGLFAAAHWSFAVFPLVGAAHFLSSLRAFNVRRYNPLSLLRRVRRPA